MSTMRGMFAIRTWIGRNSNNPYRARFALGEKPLYTAYSGTRSLFGSDSTHSARITPGTAKSIAGKSHSFSGTITSRAYSLYKKCSGKSFQHRRQIRAGHLATKQSRRIESALDMMSARGLPHWAHDLTCDRFPRFQLLEQEHS